ncbi:hypothetical protein BHM03_00060809, partial [Ensete ventricosum]
AALECILDVIRALPLGSCLPSDGQSGGSSPSSPASPASETRRHRRGPRRRPRGSPEEEQIHGTPGKMFLNGATSAASLFTQQGRKGINQDAMIVWEVCLTSSVLFGFEHNFGDRNDTVFCGVFDGHGPNGHMVARKVRDILPLKLRASWEVYIERDKHSGTLTILKDSFLKAFRIVDKELRLHPDIDCFYSGTTAVTLVKQGQDLVIGNVGDSRAVLGTRDQHNTLVAVQLTVDLKPNLPSMVFLSFFYSYSKNANAFLYIYKPMQTGTCIYIFHFDICL